MEETRTCKSCGNTFSGRFCNICGEKVILPADRSFSKLLSDIMVAITFADSKVFRTLALVIRQPGFISKEFTEGRTIRYLPPLSLFFVLNLIYFLFPLIQLFSATWRTQLSTSYSYLVELMSLRYITSNGLTRDSFELLYNTSTLGYAKLLVILFAILASLPMNILYRRASRYFTDHIGLMVELACFNLLANALLITVLAKILPIGGYLNEIVLTILFISTNFYFLIRASATFYGESGWKLFAKSAVAVIFLKVALEGYRLILFLVTMMTI